MTELLAFRPRTSNRRRARHRATGAHRPPRRPAHRLRSRWFAWMTPRRKTAPTPARPTPSPTVPTSTVPTPTTPAPTTPVPASPTETSPARTSPTRTCLPRPNTVSPTHPRTGELRTNVLSRVPHWPDDNDLLRADLRRAELRAARARTVSTHASVEDDPHLAFLNRILEGLRAL